MEIIKYTSPPPQKKNLLQSKFNRFYEPQIKVAKNVCQVYQLVIKRFFFRINLAEFD